MTTPFGINCSAKSRGPQCDQQRAIPLPISVTPSSSVSENLEVYVANSSSFIPGLDTNSGLNPESPVRTLNRATEIVRELGYNRSATIYLKSDSENPTSVTNFTFGTDSENTLNLSSSINGLQQPELIVRSHNYIVKGSVNVVSISADSPARNYMVRIVVGSTAGIQPGYLLQWNDTGDTLIVGDVVDATTLEVAAITTDSLPSAGVSLSILCPGANLQLFNSNYLVGNGNRVTLENLSIGFNSNSSGTIKNLNIDGLSLTTSNVIFHNEDASNLNGNGGNIISNSISLTTNTTALLGFSYGTSGPIVLSNNLLLTPKCPVYEGKSVVFDYSDIDINNTVRLNSLIYKRQSKILLPLSNSITNIENVHFLEMINNNPSSNNFMIRLLDIDIFRMGNVFIDATNASANIGSLISLDSAVARFINPQILCRDDAGCISATNNSDLFYGIKGAPNFIAGTYTLSSNVSGNTINLITHSKMTISSVTNVPINIINNSAAAASRPINMISASLDARGTGADPLVITTAGNKAIRMESNCNAFFLNCNITSTSDDIEVRYGSKVMAQNVTYGGGNVIVGSLGSIVPPPANQTIVNATTINTASAGEGVIYTSR